MQHPQTYFVSCIKFRFPDFPRFIRKSYQIVHFSALQSMHFCKFYCLISFTISQHLQTVKSQFDLLIEGI